MFGLALLLHLLAASPAAAASPGAPAPEAPAAEPVPVSATSEGSGSAADPLAARPSRVIPSYPRPSISPPLRGPLGGGELVLAGVGALAGDALVLGVGYGALQLFARGAIDPTAANFRRTAYALGGAALIVPPLLAVLGARLAAGRHAPFWRALLLATGGQALALGVGYLASPRLWAVIPAQLAAVTSGASIGLHWRSRPDLAAPPGESSPSPPPAGGSPLAWFGACPVGG